MHGDFPGVLEVLLSRGIPVSVLKAAASAAHLENISAEEYLVRNRLVTPDALYSALAEYCGVPFLPERGFRFRTFNDKPLILGQEAYGPTLLSLHRDRTLYTIAPEPGQFEAVYKHLAEHPRFACQIRITTPKSLRLASRILNTPAGELESRFPLFSARKIRLPWIFYALTAALGLVPFILGVPLVLFLFALTLLISITCFGAGLVRLVSAFAARRDQLIYKLPAPLRTGPIRWPTYTVLVPLYREARVLSDLVTVLDRLNYPRDRLQILFLVESDDRETLAAMPPELPAHMDVMILPDGHPRTKPRALAYGLAAATGEFVTVYDAEDRPDPDQLKTAALFFELGPPDLACLQARLAIDNFNESYFTRQFALEYACQFDQFLPWLFKNRLPFPLGGTSNHFRTSALHAVGGWDRYNVTEDADLGFRLDRLGYRVGMLPSHTLEEAPVTFRAWLAQRARWHKGWLQTLLVHGQSPQRLVADLGLWRAVAVASIFVGSFLLVALHPVVAVMVMLYFIGVLAVPVLMQEAVLLSASFFIGGFVGYAGTLAAVWMGARRRGYGVRVSDCFGMLIYWLCAGLAFYRAVWDLYRAPSQWNKTEHGVSKQRPPVKEQLNRRGG